MFENYHKFKYPGTGSNYPGIRVLKKYFKYPGTRVIDNRHWTHYICSLTLTGNDRKINGRGF
jgi:hypothetical protein